MNNQFAGYADIGGTLIHVSELRKHTADIRRFLEYLPRAQELRKHEPRSPEWCEIVDSVDDIDKLITTQRELGHIDLMLEAELNKKLEARA